MNTMVGNDYTFSFNYDATIWTDTTPTGLGSDDFIKVVIMFRAIHDATFSKT
jgi:hypothetical protein